MNRLYKTDKKLVYTIRRADVFKAISRQFLPERCFLEVGSLWCTVALSQKEKASYPYPISLLTN